eukprot:scaffold80942_cov56-Attheya_sp.AAC.2
MAKPVTSTRPTDSAVRLAWPTGTGYAIVDRRPSLSEAGITSFLCFWMSSSYRSFYAQSAETKPKTGQKDGRRLRHKFSPRPHQIVGRFVRPSSERVFCRGPRLYVRFAEMCDNKLRKSRLTRLGVPVARRLSNGFNRSVDNNNV